MKKGIIVLSVVLLTSSIFASDDLSYFLLSSYSPQSIPSSTSEEFNKNEDLQEKAKKILAELLISLYLNNVRTLNVIDWKIGDYSNYNLDLGFFGKGKVHKEATKEEGNAVWVVTTAKIQSGDQKIETLISRADGKILKIIVNGKEEKYQDHDLEVTLKEESQVTVPAGTFKAIHIKITDHTEKMDIESWLNMKEIVLEGMAKSIVKKNMFLNITTELTDFGRKSLEVTP